jgi:hypothetical protein
MEGQKNDFFHRIQYYFEYTMIVKLKLKIIIIFIKIEAEATITIGFRLNFQNA